MTYKTYVHSLGVNSAQHTTAQHVYKTCNFTFWIKMDGVGAYMFMATSKCLTIKRLLNMIYVQWLCNCKRSRKNSREVENGGKFTFKMWIQHTCVLIICYMRWKGKVSRWWLSVGWELRVEKIMFHVKVYATNSVYLMVCLPSRFLFHESFLASACLCSKFNWW